MIRRRIFLPLAASPEAVAAQISLVETIRDVMVVANRQAARAGAFSLDDGGALDALKQLYVVQKDLTTLFLSNIPGVVDLQHWNIFATTLAGYLDATLPGGAPGLKLALDSARLVQAVTAQKTINDFVRNWDGEVPTISLLSTAGNPETVFSGPNQLTTYSFDVLYTSSKPAFEGFDFMLTMTNDLNPDRYTPWQVSIGLGPALTPITLVVNVFHQSILLRPGTAARVNVFIKAPAYTPGRSIKDSTSFQVSISSVGLTPVIRAELGETFNIDVIYCLR